MRVSHVVQERLLASLGIREGSAVPPEAPTSQPVEKGIRHHSRLSMDSLIWDRLAREAAKQRVCVTQVVRQQLREAVIGGFPERRRQGPSELADRGSGQDVPDDEKVAPKSIIMYEL